MESARWDFIEWLGSDMSTSVLMHLGDPADLVRASAVSRSWHNFVVANGFCKNLCLRLHPEVSNFVHVTEVRNSTEPLEAGSSSSSDWECLEKDHRVYALFGQLLNSPALSGNCIQESIAASSTDNYPDESIENTLESSERVNRRPSYWSSSGKKDARVPETLTYRLSSNLCVVHQINIQPFQAYFQIGHPIYSSEAVRFKMGHSLLPKEMSNSRDGFAISHNPDDYVWMYVSPTYPMMQANVLQTFKLPKPVICIGGIIQIELLGRVQKQEIDGLFYVCICHVQVIGRSLSPVFNVDFLDAPRKFSLEYFPDTSWVRDGTFEHEAGESSGQPDGDSGGSSSWHSFADRIRQLGPAGRAWNEVILTTLLGGGTLEFDEEDYESDEEPFL